MAPEEDNSGDPALCCARRNEGGPSSADKSPASPSDSSDTTGEEEDMLMSETPGDTQAIGIIGEDKVGPSRTSTVCVVGYYSGSSGEESNGKGELTGSTNSTSFDSSMGSSPGNSA